MMYKKCVLTTVVLLLGFMGRGQDNQDKLFLPLDQAVKMALENSTSSKIAETGVLKAENELQTARNHQYPDFDISGQALYLTAPNLNLGYSQARGEGSTPDDNGQAAVPAPEPNYAMLGRATLSLPIYAGGKIQHGIEAGKDNLKAAQFNAEYTKAELAMQVISTYIDLYKAEQTLKVIEKSLESAGQRVKDFKNMMDNGVLAKNDYLKAKLQQSNIKLSLEKTKKSKRVLNYQLVTLLHLPEKTTLIINEQSLRIAEENVLASSIGDRADIEALRYRRKAAKENLAVTKGDYYPSLALTSGYIALDLEEVVQVTNAVNVGVGISYNLANIFKNKSKVHRAENQLKEVGLRVQKAQEAASVELKSAQENYQLALDNYNVYTESEEQAKENYRIVKDKYDNGLQDTNDLLEADLQRLQAEIDKTTARVNITERYYELRKAAGNLTEEFKTQ